MCHIIMRSINANLSAFECYLDMLQMDFSVIGITETWLNKSTCDLHSLMNYEMEEQHRDCKSGDGVALFIRNETQYQTCKDLQVFNDYCESVFVEIEKTSFITEENIILGVLYRPASGDINCFIDNTQDVLGKARLENNLIYLMGDYNINLLNVESHSLTADFNDLMYSHGLIPLITRPTRVTENSATIIDNIFTYKILNTHEESVQGFLVTDISDHYPSFCVNKTIVQRNINVTYTHRVFSAKNKRRFVDEVSAVN